MAILGPIEDQTAWDEWVAERPAVIQEMIQRCPPNRLYRIESGHRVVIRSYGEDRTVSVFVSGMYNRVLFGRIVFGIPIEELVECDLPSPSEDVGDTAEEAGYSQKDVEEILIPRLREHHACSDPSCAMCKGRKP